MDIIEKQVAKSALWNIIGSSVYYLILFIVDIILIRVLNPEDFGLIASASIFIGIFLLLGDFGFGLALIQKKEITKREKNSIFWISNLIGFLLFTFFYFLAKPIAEQFEDSRLVNIIQILAINFISISFSIVSISLLKKNLFFKKIIFVDLASCLISGLIALYMAFNNFGVYSLVYYMIALNFLKSLGYFLICEFKPNIDFRYYLIKDFISFGKNVTGVTIINYMVSHVDYYLIGKFNSQFSLGIYSKSFQMMQLPTMVIKGPLSKVLYSAMSENDDKIKMYYLKFVQILQFLFIPLFAFFFFNAKSLILILFGEGWIEMVEYFQVFSLVGLFQALGFYNVVFMALNKTHFLFIKNLILKIVLGILIIIGFKFFGVIGCALGFLIGSILNEMIMNHLVLNHLEISLNKFYFLYFKQLVLILPYVVFHFVSSLYLNDFVFIRLLVNIFAIIFLYLVPACICNKTIFDIIRFKKIFN